MVEEAMEFSRVYDGYHGKVVAYAARLLGRDEADDVAQEVFVKIDRALPTLDDPARLASWVFAMTINTVRDTLRARASRGAPRMGGRPLPEWEVEDRTTRSPEEVAERNEMIACYLEYVGQLPPPDHEVYVLSEFEGLSNSDIARQLGLRLGAVKMRLHRARSKLHEELRRNCRCYVNERGELMAEPRE